MAFKMTLWLCALMFIATLYNAVSAYDAMGGVDVQHQFMKVGLLQGKADMPVPPRKPLEIEQLAAY